MSLVKKMIFIFILGFFILDCTTEEALLLFKVTNKIERSKQKRTRKVEVQTAEKAPKKDDQSNWGETTFKNGDKYEYSSIGKRDPFKENSEEKTFKEKIRDENKVIDPLTKYDVSQFQLIGTMSSTSNPIAMLNAPDQKSYVVKIGSLVGKYGGYVTRIDNYSVIIVQEFRDPSGKIVKKNTILKIEPKEKEEEIIEVKEIKE